MIYAPKTVLIDRLYHFGTMFDYTNDELFTKGMESQLNIYLLVIVQKTPPVLVRLMV